jgi:hypothetical protein
MGRAPIMAASGDSMRAGCIARLRHFPITQPTARNSTSQVGPLYTGFRLMKKMIARKPPSGAPDGTVWFGGPVDKFKITLRIFGEELDPDRISELLGCVPTTAERKGIPISSGGATRIPKKGRWFLTIHSKDCGEPDDVEDGIKMLLARLPSNGDLWTSLASMYTVDIFCGLFLTSSNRGFGISAEVSKLLSDRYLEIGFDLYFDPPK